VLTEENILKVLDKEDKSGMFSEDSDDFSFGTCEEDSDSELDTGSVVHESELEEKVSDLVQPVVPHGVECRRFSFLVVSGVTVDFYDETSVLECFQKFTDEEMWQLFAEQTNIYIDQFFSDHPNLKPRS
jgi:hypothetical protein